ncbi:hypothetical protein B0H21DRAFT_760442 [Amylocystis lapponica]|nr:hypothetical protein B0H21DRAFT_760442 [Amylocystis lapponica]
MARIVLSFVVAAAFQPGVLAQTWCGKNYMAGSPVVPPGGQFPTPATTSSPLLAFRCAPAIKPYIPDDASSPAGILIDTYVTYSDIVGAAPISIPDHGDLGSVAVTVSTNGHVLADGTVPLNASKVELPFSLSDLEPTTGAYNISCTATYAVSGAATQSFNTSGALSYLPAPPDGRSVTKMDLRTGALLAKPATGKGGTYEPVMPVGFYTTFGGYLASNLSIINEVKDLGYTVIHPVPAYDNLTQLAQVIERMEEVGMYLMYDMRWTYQNTTAITEEVNRVKNSPALLLWYTGDEPDGTSDPLNATSIAYDLIYKLDGYHPVSLCLNCENYYWNEYSAGADIVMQDAYPIGNNVTFSSQWGTACTPEYGDCGCDNCKGDFEDISTRLDEFHYRLWVDGWDRTKALWTVPQGFGQDTYWPDYPTGQQFVVQSIVGINHGGRGVVSWDMPTTDEILQYGARLARASAVFTPYIASPAAVFAHVFVGQVDVGLWTVAGKTLVLAANLNYAAAAFDLGSVPGLQNRTAPVVQILDSGASANGSVISFESTGSGGFVVG